MKQKEEKRIYNVYSDWEQITAIYKENLER